MCTALSYRTKDHYFGRNLDVEKDYGEHVVITPRNFPLKFRYAETMNTHYALIGMAVVINDYPLYFEAANEMGLSIAGLNFPDNAVYYDYAEGKENVAPYELPLYLLGICTSIKSVKKLLKKINIVNHSFSEELPLSPLHWMISDREQSITLECTKDGMKVYENPFGVLTNNPTFDYHIMNMNNYMELYEGAGRNRLGKNLKLKNYSLGLGALGLPGDFSSSSRFVKTVFVKEKSVCNGEEEESVSQFFHILEAAAMPKGCVKLPNGEYEYTKYSCCFNTDALIFYYKTYYNSSIRKIELFKNDLEKNKLIEYA